MPSQSESAGDSQALVPIGEVLSVSGAVSATRPGATSRRLDEGAAVYANDRIVTEAGAEVVITLADGTRVNVPAAADVVLKPADDAVSAETPPRDVTGSAADAAIVQAIVAGLDPALVTPPPGAGPGPAVAADAAVQNEGDITFVRVERTAGRATPESGFETQGFGGALGPIRPPSEEEDTRDLRPQLRVGDITVPEPEPDEEGVALVTISLSVPSDQEVRVDFRTADATATAGLDYRPVSGTAVFAPGTTAVQIAIPTLGDIPFEGPEDLRVELSNPSPSAIIADELGVVTIIDDETPVDGDVPALVIDDVAIEEPADGDTGIMTFTVSLGAASEREVTVDYTTVDGTAIAGADYEPTSGTLTFPPGVRTVTIPVTVNGDAVVEGSEALTVALSNPVNAVIADPEGLGTIVDEGAEKPIAKVAGAPTVPEGEFAEFAVELSTPSASSSTVNVTVSGVTASAGSDFDSTGLEYFDGTDWLGFANGGALTFAPGQTAIPIRVRTLDDAGGPVFEGPETFEVALSDAGDANVDVDPTPATGTIVDEKPIVSITGQPSVAEGEVAVFAVELSGPLGVDSTVNVTARDVTATGGVAEPADYDNVGLEFLDGETWVPFANGAALTVPAGAVSVPVRVRTIDDAAQPVFEGPETFELVLTTTDDPNLEVDPTPAVGTITDAPELPPIGDLEATVTEAALVGDGIAGSNRDPGQPEIGATAQGTLPGSGITDLSFVSGPGGGATLSDTADTLTLTATDGSWTLDVAKASGEYEYRQLAPVEHSVPDAAFAADLSPLEIQFEARDAEGGAALGTLRVSVRDDQPHVVAQEANVDESTSSNTNLVVVLDRSGSMRQDPGTEGFDSRFALAKAAVDGLMGAYSELGQLNVLIVDFSAEGPTSVAAASSDWFEGADARTGANDYLASLRINGRTNYEAALSEVQAAFSPPPGGAGFTNVLYFLSDGVPNTGGVDDNGQLPREFVADWETFLETSGIVTAYAVGTGSDIEATDPELADVAWPNDNALNPIVVPESDLIDTLIGTVGSTLTGNIIDGAAPGTIGFGADGGFIESIEIDGVTYTYDPASGAVSESGEGRQGSAQLLPGAVLVETNLGGQLGFNFATTETAIAGDYRYVPTLVDGNQVEQIAYTLADNEGDTATDTLSITVNDLPEATASESLTSLDSPDEDPILVDGGQEELGLAPLALTHTVAGPASAAADAPLVLSDVLDSAGGADTPGLAGTVALAEGTREPSADTFATGTTRSSAGGFNSVLVYEEVSTLGV